MSTRTKIFELLDRIAESEIKLLAESAMMNPNRLDMGRTAIVNRIRGGQVQMRKTVSETKGFKIVDGSLVKMTPEEMRRRKFAAKISARKRRSMVSQILRNRNISLRKRDSRFGDGLVFKSQATGH